MIDSNLINSYLKEISKSNKLKIEYQEKFGESKLRFLKYLKLIPILRNFAFLYKLRRRFKT